MSIKLMPSDQEFELMQRMAKAYAHSGLFNLESNTALALAVLLKAWGLGIPVTQAFEFFHIMSKKISVSANGQAYLLKRAGFDYKVIKLDDTVCILEIYNPHGEHLGESSFSMKDAEKAELTVGKSSGNWRKYPRNMMFARAISNALTFYAPEATGGSPAYTEDELSNGASEVVPVVDDVDYAFEQVNNDLIIEALEGGLDFADEDTPEVESSLADQELSQEQPTDQRLDDVSAISAADAQKFAVEFGKLYSNKKVADGKRYFYLSEMSGRNITSTKDLTHAEGQRAFAILDTFKFVAALLGSVNSWEDHEPTLMAKATKKTHEYLWLTSLGEQKRIKEVLKTAILEWKADQDENLAEAK